MAGRSVTPGMSKPSDEAVRKEFEAWYESQYARYRNGYLAGYLAETIFAAGFAIGRSAAIQECADLVDESISDVPTWPLRDAILALKER